jgi:hypothetical protein
VIGTKTTNGDARKSAPVIKRGVSIETDLYDDDSEDDASVFSDEASKASFMRIVTMKSKRNLDDMELLA